MYAACEDNLLVLFSCLLCARLNPFLAKCRWKSLPSRVLDLSQQVQTRNTNLERGVQALLMLCWGQLEVLFEEHHNNLIVWMGMTSVWQGLQDQNSVTSLLNTKTVEKLQDTKPKALETEAAGDFSAQWKSLRCPEHPAFMGWRSLSTVCLSTVSHKT